MKTFLFFVSLFLFLSAGDIPALSYSNGLLGWYDANRVQAHVEHPIEYSVIQAPAYHKRIAEAGAVGLTRIIDDVDEGAWWPSSVGEVHELAKNRDVAKWLIDDVHQNGMHMIGYFRFMSDAFMQKEHPDWICRDHAGVLFREPRAILLKRKDFVGVLCANSPYRDFVKTRLVELTERGMDMVYFDNMHMPPVCTCDYCQAKFEKKYGKPFPFKKQKENGAGFFDDFESYKKGLSPVESIYSDDYIEVANFVGESLIDAFSYWHEACSKINSNVRFAIGTSMAPLFTMHPQMTPRFVSMVDVPKTEYDKPFGGNIERELPGVEGLALPSFDMQVAIGWSMTRDAAGGRPPLMWIHNICELKEALYTSAAAVTYGCIASMQWAGRAAQNVGGKTEWILPADATSVFKPAFDMGKKVSPYFVNTRPYGWAALYLCYERRNSYLDSKADLLAKVTGPMLGAGEALKEAHIPWITVNEVFLDEAFPDDIKVLIIPGDNLPPSSIQKIEALKMKGIIVIALNPEDQWHLASQKDNLKKSLIKEIIKSAGEPPLQIAGPAAMHAAFYKNKKDGNITCAMVNDFGWFERVTGNIAMPVEKKKEHPHYIGNHKEPPVCSKVVLKINDSYFKTAGAAEALTGANLKIESKKGITEIEIPDFQIQSCVKISK